MAETLQLLPVLAMVVTVAVAWGGMRASNGKVTDELKEVKIGLAELRSTVSQVAALSAMAQSAAAELDRVRAALHDIRNHLQKHALQIARVESRCDVRCEEESES